MGWEGEGGGGTNLNYPPCDFWVSEVADNETYDRTGCYDDVDLCGDSESEASVSIPSTCTLLAWEREKGTLTRSSSH